MATALDVALEVLPHFSENVLVRRVLTYGYYAASIGRDPKTEAVCMGPAFHAIGAACVFCGIPVAPLYFVERADGKDRTIFESDVLEAMEVLPHYELMYVAAREYTYGANEFQEVEHLLRKLLRKGAQIDWSPHFLWHVAIVRKPKDQDTTYFQIALERYREIIEEKKRSRRKSNASL